MKLHRKHEKREENKCKFKMEKDHVLKSIRMSTTVIVNGMD